MKLNILLNLTKGFYMPAFNAIIKTKHQTISVQRYYAYNRKEALKTLFKQYSKFLGNITDIKLFDDTRKLNLMGKISKLFHTNN
jgi:hypothetical protein